MRLVSLFAGIGGFDLGFERAGFEIVAHVEKDPSCRKLLQVKWPNAVCLDDVYTAGAHNLPKCDIVTFGFPCQDLSVAGKRAGLSGKRSGLFYESMRIIDEIEPTWCLWENVPGLYSSDKGRDLARVLLRLAQSDYFGAVGCIDAQWHGVGQRRRRLFGLFTRLNIGAKRCAEILSFQSRLSWHIAPSRKKGKVAPCLAASGAGAGRTGNERNEVDFCIEVSKTVRTPTGGIDREDMHTLILDVSRTISCNNARGGIPSSDGLDGMIIPDVAGCLQERDAKGADSDTKPGHLISVNTGRGYWNESDKVGTLGTEARSVHENNLVPAIGMRVRRLTPTEYERLQGFPDGWTEGFSDSTRYKMLGNAVCVNVSEWIAKRIAGA